MSRRNNYDASYGLEHQLSQSIERMRDNITRSHQLKQEIIKLRRQRRKMQSVPDEVKQWFEETADFTEEEEE